ncbi:MAG: lipoate protein ligase C-terminal domain-containing protein [Acidimicrobiia bacterium]|nr:MAG: lipoate protein ligase C-terminal domain-containing protein [Acidimicrobiia bacterium]
MSIRLLDFGTVGSLRSLAIFHGVAYALKPEHPDTITLTRPLDPFVSIGHHQDAMAEVDLEYCDEAGVPVYRREVGGGAVYLDEGQTFWHTIFHQSRVPATLADVYTKFLAGPVLTLNRIGIPAVHRPVNDIQVEGRKVGGTGAATIGESMVVAGSLMFDFNYELMSRVLRVPSEKFRDKVYSTMREYLTTINRELGDDTPDRADVERILVESFAETLETEVVEDEPRRDELDAIEKQEERIASEEWLHLDGLPHSGDLVKIAQGVTVVEGVHKAPGGLIRATVAVRDGKIDGIVLSGDFFIEPAEARAALQDALVGVQHNEDAVLQVVKQELSGVDAPGIDAADVAAAVMATPYQA